MSAAPENTEYARIDDLAALRLWAGAREMRAFEVLTVRYRDMVLATCRRALGGELDADDAAQETFLKLAQHGGSITSNAGAWLHACALRTCIDIRRKRGSQQRVARAAHERGTGAGEQDGTSTWRELEPQLDEAMSRLSESDRELIVQRFLLGRSQTDMAQQAGVNPGTMHRRIDGALERLRGSLGAPGTGGALGAVALAAALAHAPGSAVAGPALCASLAKVGLSALAGGGAAPASAGGSGSGLLAGLSGVQAGLLSAAALLVVGAGSWLAYSQWSAPGAMTSATGVAAALATGQAEPVAGAGVARPERPITGYKLAGMLTDGEPEGRLVFDGRSARLDMQRLPDGTFAHLLMDIVEVRADKKPPEIELKISKVNAPAPNPFGQYIGVSFTSTYERTGERLKLVARAPWDGREQQQPMLVVRPPAGHPERRELSAAGNHADLAGTWFALPDMNFTLSKDGIELAHSQWTILRHRVIEWTDAPEGARVQMICAGHNSDLGAVGKRFKCIIRRDGPGAPGGEGYTVVYHDLNTPKRDAWPTGFESTKGSGLTVLTFRKEKP
jgi:RNA polymerase sigma-70 factor (ECF subfamily)